MSDTLKFKIFFPPTGELDGLMREREKMQSCADRTAAHYAEILKEFDDKIEALRAKAQNESVAS